MNILSWLIYKMSSGKNSKLRYYTQAYLRMLLPKVYCRSRLRSLLASVEGRDDRAYILDRVAYYNQLNHPVPLPASCPPISKHRKSGSSVYYFDTLEYLRYFSPRLVWSFLPGDIVHIPDIPTIVKSRPLLPDNQNSVLMKLDKIRHFTFVRDEKPFRDKADRVIFRGKVAGKESRIQFMQMYWGHPLCDLGDVSRNSPNPDWRVGKMTIREHLDYKFIMALEGNDVASNLKWVMSSNSLAVMPRPTCETWFMEGKLIPGYHYVEIRADFSDLEAQVQYYIAHPDEAEAIIRNAHEYVAQFWNKEREDLISLLVLERYFAYTQP